MLSQIRQIGLVPAGCQPWNKNMVAGCGSSFAYCATLAVYIYEFDIECDEYKLTSINAMHSKTILSITWNLSKPQLFATSGADQKIFVWDVKQRKCVAKLLKIQCIPKSICWLPGGSHADILAFLGPQGPIYLWDTSNDSLSTFPETNGFDSEITIFKWHHTDTAKFVLGHIDGSLSFFSSGKRNKHCLRSSDVSTPTDVDPVLALLWDPLSTDYLLVSRKSSGIQLLDSNLLTVITKFKLPSHMVSTQTLSWVDSAPGMFLTGDHETGVMRLWNVSNSSPLQNIPLKSNGFHCLYALDAPSQDNTAHHSTSIPMRGCQSLSSTHSQAHAVPPARIVCAFSDGGVGLYNLQQNRWSFLREQAHIETIFDCKFKPDNPKQLATASFDGTVKLWSVDDLLTIQSTTGNEGVIYSISWAPADLNCLACGTRKRGIFVWDLNKSKIIRRFKEHGFKAVYCVAWNQRDSHRLASCSEDGLCIVRRLDGEELKRYEHPEPAFGCDWSIVDKDILATACSDGIVRVWNFVSTSSTPYRSLTGHTAKVFHVRWHPLIRNILASGSDDTTIRVWEVESSTCLAVLEGHVTCVRGLAWNFELAHLLISGSWDSTLRLWDVRDGKCIETVDDHGADIYGVATHPNNPFTVATSSRDSTLRLWSLEGVTHRLFLQVLADFPCSEIIAPPDETMKAGYPLKLSGNISRHICSMLQAKANNDCVKLRWFSELFSSTRGLENLWDLVCACRGQRESTLSQSYRKGILHTKHLTKYKAAEAQESEHASSQIKSGLRQKNKLLLRAAEVHLKLGNVRRYCELLTELGDWERAIALAPGVSLAFWAGLVKRYASILESDSDKDSVAFRIATGEITEAVEFITARGDLQDGLLVAQSAKECNTPHPTFPEECKNIKNNTDGKNYDDLVSGCCVKMADRHYKRSLSLSAASIHLAQDDVGKAIDCLVRANQLSLALCVARNLNGCFSGAKIAARLLTRKLSSLQMHDVAIKLLLAFDPPSKDCDWSSLHELCASCDVKDTNERAKLYQQAGLLSPSSYRNRAVELQGKGQLVESLKYHMLSDDQQTGLETAVQLLTARLVEDNKWTVDSVLDDLGAAFTARSSLLQTQKNKILRTKLIAFAAYFGGILATRRRYNSIVKPLFQQAKSLVEISRSFDIHFPLSPSVIQEELKIIRAYPELCSTSTPIAMQQNNNIAAQLRHRAGDEPYSCLFGVTVVDASEHPSHSNVAVSTISGTKISGVPFTLEDGRSMLSLNEATMWAKVNPFSPTSSGARLCPF